MARILITTMLALLIFGCASASKHLYDTNGIDESKLATIAAYKDQVTLVEINGRPFKGDRGDRVYLKPGVYEFGATLSLYVSMPIGPVVIHDTYRSPDVKRGCLKREPGKRYTLGMLPGKPEWKLAVFKQSRVGRIELEPCDS